MARPGFPLLAKAKYRRALQTLAAPGCGTNHTEARKLYRCVVDRALSLAGHAWQVWQTVFALWA